MKAALITNLLILGLTSIAWTEEAGLEDCLAIANTAASANAADSEALVSPHRIAIDTCLQDHIYSFSGSDEFEDLDDTLYQDDLGFGEMDSTRRMIDRRPSSMNWPESRHSSRMGKTRTQSSRSMHSTRRAMMPRSRHRTRVQSQ